MYNKNFKSKMVLTIKIRDRRSNEMKEPKGIHDGGQSLPVKEYKTASMSPGLFNRSPRSF